MTFKEKYNSVSDWYRKAIIMNMYHLAQISRTDGNWTIQYTAHYFECSIGLVSENLKIADCIQTDESIMMKMKTRREALRYIEVKHG